MARQRQNVKTKKKIPRDVLIIKASVLLVLLIVVPCAVCAFQQHHVFFQNTQRELHVYRIYGEEPGKTLLIIGGIQGNEPGGYLAADLYVEMSLKKGNLIVVPRANFSSILRNVRGINGDMNRKFVDVSETDNDAQIIDKLKELISESDFLLNLHDGSGFYCGVWQSDLRNPKRYGQSIIADCERFYSQKYNKEFHLGDMATRVSNRVNAEIKNEGHHFHFNNHRTSSHDTLHAEQRKSATYFAVTQHEIPAFGIETSKSIRSPRERVRYQTMVINAFMHEFNIIPEQPSIALPDPMMKYLIASVKDQAPLVVYNGEKLFIEEGDEINIIHVEANYDRGITANIIGAGSYNDLRKTLRISKETEIIIKKDNMKCGSVPISFRKGSQQVVSAKPRVRYLIVAVNKQKRALVPDEHVTVQRGDVLVIRDLVATSLKHHRVKVNFKGFVGNKEYNDGEDRGYPIHTAKDLMINYSLKGNGKCYPIVISLRKKTIASFFVDISDEPAQAAGR